MCSAGQVAAAFADADFGAQGYETLFFRGVAVGGRDREDRMLKAGVIRLVPGQMAVSVKG